MIFWKRRLFPPEEESISALPRLRGGHVLTKGQDDKGERDMWGRSWQIVQFVKHDLKTTSTSYFFLIWFKTVVPQRDKAFGLEWNAKAERTEGMSLLLFALKWCRNVWHLMSSLQVSRENTRGEGCAAAACAAHRRKLPLGSIDLSVIPCCVSIICAAGRREHVFWPSRIHNSSIQNSPWKEFVLQRHRFTTDARK